MSRVAVFDIDGTLADCTHRRHFVRTKPKNFAAFNAAMKYDTVKENVRQTLLDLVMMDGQSLSLPVVKVLRKIPW